MTTPRYCRSCRTSGLLLGQHRYGGHRGWEHRRNRNARSDDRTTLLEQQYVFGQIMNSISKPRLKFLALHLAAMPSLLGQI